MSRAMRWGRWAFVFWSLAAGLILAEEIVVVQRSQKPVKGQKLAGPLALLQETNGVLLRVRTDGSADVRVSDEEAKRLVGAGAKVLDARAAAEAGPADVQLLISYVAGQKPAPATLDKAGLEVIEDYPPGSFLVAKPKATAQVTASSMQTLATDKAVEFVEPAYQLSIIPPNPSERETAEQAATTETPNDPQLKNLWGMKDTRARDVWPNLHDASTIIVGVIDTGVDYKHPDLQANILRDAAGRVVGLDACDGDGDPMDENEHGTHCAGTIGGVGNNGLGVVGVCWNVKIMPLRFLDAGGSGNPLDAIKCIDFAIQHKARILSNSWGGGGYMKVLEDAIRRARDAGILFIAAAGNEFRNTDVAPNYPSCYEVDNIISVGAIDVNNNKANFSNYGRITVDIGAPGVSILSTTPDNTYSWLNGTSMATPHVAGAAALVWAANPNATCADIKNLLNKNARPAAGLEQAWGHKALVKGGVLDIGFLASVPPQPPPPPPQPKEEPPVPSVAPPAVSKQFARGQQIAGAGTLARATFTLTETREVHIIANTGLRADWRAKVELGFADDKAGASLWPESKRAVYLGGGEWVNVTTTYAAKLDKGTYDIAWKLSAGGADIQVDAGTLMIQTFPLAAPPAPAAPAPPAPAPEEKQDGGASQ